MIYIEPFGGLANRMRVIASAMWLKEKIGTKLVIIWNEDRDLNCPYYELFQDFKQFEIRHKKRTEYHLKSSISEKSQFFNKLFGVNFCIKDQDFYTHIFPGKIDLLNIAQNNKNFYIQTCQEFHENTAYFKYLAPADELQKRIDQTAKKFNNHTIGVHIRRTDNIKSIENSPLELFINKMHSEKRENPETMFFLCTDDIDTEKLILDHFTDCVITNTQIRDRDSAIGMHDALVDLFCLARTQKIFGSYWSSFSEIAAKINETPLFILKKDTLS